MAYISSNDNRFYVALEQSFGAVGTVTAANRIPALKLTTKQTTEKPQRKDKTGSRTFLGQPAGLRRQTKFELRTYMSSWADQTAQPSYGPLFQACLGSAAALWGGGTVSSSTDPSQIAFSSPHGLVPGQAITLGGEIRFASAIVDAQTVRVNAPFVNAISGGEVAGKTAMYKPASNLGSVTVFDCWSPDTSVQRVLSGAAVDKLAIKVNGDFHEFQFSGQARDLLDSTSFESGQGELTSFPVEPTVGAVGYSIVPGHLGQVWLGSSPNQFFTLTSAQLTFQNNIDLRAKEFGADLPSAIAPGQRSANLDFSLYQLDDAATKALYQAARQKSPLSVMVQLGQQQGQMFGIYMKSVVPEVPAFDDSDTRLQWTFQSCQAQGGVDDEIYVAFG
jgi:hypothetical protein